MRRSAAPGRARPHRWVAVAASALVGALWVAQVQAAPEIASVRAPAGWALAEGDARTRIGEWIGARSDARIAAVYTPNADDEFAEILALVEIEGPFTDDVDPSTQLMRALAGVPGVDTIDGDAVIVDREGAAPRIRATWQSEPLAFEAELVATGKSRVALLQVTLASEAALYARTFDEARASLVGAAAPVQSFDVGSWRLRMVLASLAIVGAFAVAVWRRPLGLNAKTLGRIGALVVVAIAAVAAWQAARTLAPQIEALTQAGSSSDRLVGEIVVAGLATALGFWIVGQVLASGDGPVASAPQRGAFADRSSPTLTSNPVIPQLPPKGERPRSTHPDGPSRLDEASRDAPGDRHRDHTPL